MLTAHLKAGANLSVAISGVPDVGRYGALELEGDIIRGFLEKGRDGQGFINAGIYLLSSVIVQRIPADETFSFEQQLLMPLVQELRPMAYRAEGRFIDIGIPADFERAQGMLAAPGIA
jgi:D-glycero-alpha-D-manno-heptose 1-phosphate guanylyltransferase